MQLTNELNFHFVSKVLFVTFGNNRAITTGAVMAISHAIFPIQKVCIEKRNMRSQGGFTTVQLRGVKQKILQRAIKKRNAFAGECKSIFPLRDIHIKTDINDETQQGLSGGMSHQITIVLKSCESLVRSCDVYKYTLKADFKERLPVKLVDKVCQLSQSVNFEGRFLDLKKISYNVIE